MVKGVQVTDDDPSYGLTLASDELNHVPMSPMSRRIAQQTKCMPRTCRLSRM